MGASRGPKNGEASHIGGVLMMPPHGGLMSQQDNQTSGRLPVSAGLILVLLCFLWGGNAVTIKFSNQGMPPFMAAALRSLISGVLV